MGVSEEQSSKRLPFCTIDCMEGRKMGTIFSWHIKKSNSSELTHDTKCWCRLLQFWPIVGWINYQYMPLQFRVVFHSFVASCWYACPPLPLPLPSLTSSTNWRFFFFLFDIFSLCIERERERMLKKSLYM